MARGDGTDVCRVRITDAPLELSAPMAHLNAGAVVQFAGYCRKVALDGATVQALELQHYPGMTERVIFEFGARVADRLGLATLDIVHRVGKIPAGDAIVLVSASAPHRKAAFEAVEATMDFLKTEAPLWKREHTSTGAHWIEPTHDDAARSAKRRGHE